MNIASKTTNGILYISFNQDSSCISVSTRCGYSIYTCDPFSKVYGKQLPAISLARMLFCTSLVALVGAGEHPSYSPRRLQIVNTKRQSTICDLTFTTSVIGVELNRKRLVVVLEEHLYIYDIANMKLLHTIDTTPNPNSLCCLAASPDNCYLAYPSNTSSNSGELMIFDAVKLQSVNIISAHKSQLACITFNHEGTLLATSSDKVRVIKKGTVIRVFSCPDGKLLGQFRRGMNSARIRSLAFSMDSTYLCLSSDSDTIHIYKLDNSSNSDSQSPTLTQQPSQNIVRQNSTGGMLSSLSSPLFGAATQVGNMLPSKMTNIWEPMRHFAFAKLPNISSSNSSKDRSHICSFTPSETPLLVVVTSDGDFLLYNVNIEGGECGLVKQESILGPEES